MLNEILMCSNDEEAESLYFSKTNRTEEEWLTEVMPVKKKKPHIKKLSKKQLLDALEEHNDGYIYEDRKYHHLDDGE